MSWKIGFLCVFSTCDSARGCSQLPTHLCRRAAHADIESISLSSNRRENLTVEVELGITFSLINYGQGTRAVKYKPWEQQVNLSGHCELEGLYRMLPGWGIREASADSTAPDFKWPTVRGRQICVHLTMK